MKNIALSLLALILIGGCGSVGNIFKVFCFNKRNMRENCELFPVCNRVSEAIALFFVFVFVFFFVPNSRFK